jgi:hypothetical protein
VRFESLSFLNAQNNIPHGCLLSQTCRKKIKEMMRGTADEKQQQWLELVNGRNNLEISVAAYNAKIVAIGPCGAGCDVQLFGDACAGSARVTVANVKRELEQKHGIDWAEPEFNYCLRKLRDDRAAENLDDGSELLDWGVLLMLFPANPKQLLQLPPVLFKPPAESMEIDGTHLIPINVKSCDCNSEVYIDMLLPCGCSARRLLQLLSDAGVGWALRGAKVMTFSNKLIKSDAVIPAACDLPLKVVQTSD